MRKTVEISADNNTVTLQQKGNSTPSFVKVYNSKKRLIRHSRTTGSKFQFSAAPGKYIVETDGELEMVGESNKDRTENLKKLYDHLEIDLPNNMLILKGLPFYQTDDLGTFINRMVKDKIELQGYIEAHYDRVATKARKKGFSDVKIVEIMAGGGTATEQAKIKKGLQDIDKEKKRIKTALGKAKNAKEMLKITPKFPRITL